MHDYLLSVILGVIEGLTEFLPVSSTAHLRIAEAIAHSTGLSQASLQDPYWKMYTIVIQLGAVLCLPVYFWPRLRRFVKTFPRGERGNLTVLTHPLGLTVIAFVVTAVPVWLLSKLIGKNLESLYVMGTALVVGGIVMWIVDAFASHRQAAAEAGHGTPMTSRLEDMHWWQAVWVGAVQILSAVFPGTSRSMATIAGGQIAGMTRAAALEFSFFLSIPTMFAATGYDLLKSITGRSVGGQGAGAPLTMDADRWIVLGIGFGVSFLVAWAVVAWFMHWVRRRGFAPFAIYRIGLGAVVLIWAARSGTSIS